MRTREQPSRKTRLLLFWYAYFMKLYLVRHGETEANQKGIIQGWTHGVLTENGHSQVKRSAKEFKQPVDAVFSSDLGRCVDTMRYFASHHPGIPVFKDWRLRERNFGQAEGKKRDEIQEDYYWSIRDTEVAAGGETLDDYNRRIESFVDSIKKVHMDLRAVLVVTHGGAINRFRDMYDFDWNHLPPDNVEVAVIDI